MAMSEKERKQLMGLLIAVALAGPVMFWMYWRTPTVAEAANMRVEIDSLRAKIDTAKADLALGIVETLQATVSRYERALSVMRELVPGEEEVTSLVDSVSSRAQLRGVEIVSISPQAPEVQGPFQVNRTQLSVVGPYDEIGEFLSDIASLRRIMVPYNLTLDLAPPAELAGYLLEEGRTYLRASFMVRTFVKSRGAEGVGAGG